MKPEDRKRAWQSLPEPRPPWETFKRMLYHCDYNPEKVRENYLKNLSIAAGRLDEEGERVNGGHSIG
tara:strand:- start:884 stop:1084 length:201 start_codon:yes stop_codon:yes gene_type:complete